MISNSLSDDTKESDSGHRFDSPFPYTEIFYEKFPYYLSIGMTEEQYWDKDASLVKFYRKAEEIRRDRVNQEFWLQGMYFYDSLLRVSPILHAFAKKGTKPKPYVDDPYPINRKMMEDAELKKEKAQQEKARRFMEAFMVKNNKRFEERK